MKQDGCDKVYISTSDVQMHANYHRKDSAIMQEGFQRFRATELCRTGHCPFNGQRTTHFHCIRSGCTFTFKNKADMGKLTHYLDNPFTLLALKNKYRRVQIFCEVSSVRFEQILRDLKMSSSLVPVIENYRRVTSLVFLKGKKLRFLLNDNFKSILVLNLQPCQSEDPS